VLARSSTPPARLCVEITESAVMSDPKRARAALLSLKTLGVTIAIDDFGTGQTSLEQIASLPIEELKVDRSFVQHADRERECAVVATISTLASALSISAVVEGIETAEQACQMGELGYPLAQGFFFSRPEPFERLTQRLRHATAEIALETV
jgi:EAL domain-containing protein (putative c-di-GMP-specific phosphodiesterase class I)